LRRAHFATFAQHSDRTALSIENWCGQYHNGQFSEDIQRIEALMKIHLKQFLWSGLVISLMCMMAACSSPTLPATSTKTPENTSPTPGVVVTAWAALANGTLIKTDGCLLLRSSDDNTAYTLVWPPDFAVTIEGDTVKVTSGIIAGSRIETIHRIGEKVTLGGGTTNQLSEALQKTVPANCAAPYWVVGSVSGKQ
jgi:hypothetical protein